MKKALLFFAFATVSLFPCFAQKVISGPKVGHVDFREINIWLQLDQAGSITIQLSELPDSGKVGQRKTVSSGNWQTLMLTASADNDFIVKARFPNVEPGKRYIYRIPQGRNKFLSGIVSTPALWRHRTDPPEINFALGSCHYTNDPPDDRPGRAYGDSNNRIFESIAAKSPDFMLWLGDNIYLREPDWNSRSGIYRRYRLMHANPSLRDLFANYPNYAIWDDHDFGPNDADRSFFNKKTTLQAFCDNWANPTCNGNDFPGITTAFQWGDADFFLLDGRYHRAPNDLKDSTKTYFGEAQLQWLLDNLVSSRATFKIVAVGGQFLSDAKVFENVANYAVERRAIIDFIRENNIKNVIFLSGDRHFSELSMTDGRGGPRIIDFTVSPLSAGTARVGDSENNTLSIPGSRITGKRNFGMLSISGKFRERKLKFTIFDSNGNELYSQELMQQ